MNFGGMFRDGPSRMVHGSQLLRFFEKFEFRYLMTTRRDDEQRRKQPEYTHKGELDRSHDSYRSFMSHRYAPHEESSEAREV